MNTPKLTPEELTRFRAAVNPGDTAGPWRTGAVIDRLLRHIEALEAKTRYPRVEPAELVDGAFYWVRQIGDSWPLAWAAARVVSYNGPRFEIGDRWELAEVFEIRGPIPIPEEP